MAVSIEERQAISRRNGAKGRGPISDYGKFISSRNSIKHGYYAKVHCLPDECPVETARLRERWFADVAPGSIDEEFLTLECFQANLMANRVHRARCAQLTAEQNQATRSWHDERDKAVGKLWQELLVTSDAQDILFELQATTLGLRALSGEWSRLAGLLEDRGYWLPGELTQVVILSGSRNHERMLFEDEDAYRLYLWNLRCEPEPPWDVIERMLVPANRPPGLRDVDGGVLLPGAAECRAWLAQWARDVLQELDEDYERVWTVEAPQLARRTAPKAIVTDVEKEKQLHRASSEYRAMYYKAHNALEALRKRKAAEAKEVGKNAGREDSRRSDEWEAPAGRAGRSDPVAPAPVAPACVVEVKAEAEPGPCYEPGVEAENRPLADTEVPAPGVAARAQDEPSFVTETPADVAVPARATDPASGVPGDVRSRPRWGGETRAERTPVGTVDTTIEPEVAPWTTRPLGEGMTREERKRRRESMGPLGPIQQSLVDRWKEDLRKLNEELDAKEEQARLRMAAERAARAGWGLAAARPDDAAGAGAARPPPGGSTQQA